MVARELSAVLKAAKQRLGRPALDYLATREAVNLAWYLEEKIIKARDEEVGDHVRVLKYADILCRKGAKVTFLRETWGVKTPDLKVELEPSKFFLEVKRFRPVPNTANPASKIVAAVTAKRLQLPSNEVGFVAIDNFDLHLESEDQCGLTDRHIHEALWELERSAGENPNGWQKPSGVIIAASTSGGLGTQIPHFVWMNKKSKPPASEEAARWLSSLFADVDTEISREVLRRKVR
jgi:hypothetical protein